MYMPIKYIKEVENVKIWRYMDVSKFIALLHSESLFFSNINNFNDKYEGSYALENIESRNRLGYFGVIDEQFQKARDLNKKLRETMHVNCWHMNDHESEAMWKLYLNNDLGIVIQSTVDKLKKSLENADENVHIGKISYIDYSKDLVPEKGMWGTFFYKRESFKHEQELRAIVCKGYEPEDIPENERHGTSVLIDLESLVEKIYISPDSQGWYDEVIRSVINKYGFKFNVVPSQMNNEPYI